MIPQPRVAIGTIFTECNQLGGVPITLDWFERYELLRGEEILALDSGVAGGMLQTLAEGNIQPIPLLYATTSPGGPLTTECYRVLKDELLATLSKILPVDGVLLPLHGAAAVDDVGDLEGDLLEAVRNVIGPDTPLVATLDLHAHVTATMVEHADALLAWETYPHADALSTGRRGAQMMVEMLAGRWRPTMAMAKIPVITSAIHGSTHGDAPFAQLMRQAKALEGNDSVLSTSMILVHPYLDQPDMGSGAIVITNNDLAGAVTKADELARAYWARRFDLEPETWSPADAIAEGMRLDGGPVLLVETADCCGGGASGDSIATLAALLAAGITEPTIVPVVDPAAAQTCHQAGVGAEVTLTVGHQQDPRWGEPISITGDVTHLAEGRFRYEGGIFDGVEGNMGPSVILAVNGIDLLITTFATYDWRDEQFRAMGLEPRTAKFIVVKNPMNFGMAYGAYAKGAFILDTPGPTPATLRNVSFQKLTRPYFPLDEEIPGLAPTIST